MTTITTKTPAGNAIPDLPDHPGVGQIANRLATDTLERITRARMSGERVSDQKLSRSSGLSRQSVNRYLNPNLAAGNMPLSLFISGQLETGGDPVQALADAIAGDTEARE